jgi:hypothetical protein
MNADLNEVKAGDTLIYITIWDRTLCKVKSITPTQIVTDRGRFKKKNGFRIGGDTQIYSKVAIPKEGEIKQIEERIFIQGVLYKVGQLTYNDVSYAQAVNIKQILGL